MSNINLITVNLGQIEKKLKYLKLIRSLAVFSLIAIVCVALIVFLLNTVALPFASIEKETKSTLISLNLQHGKLVKYTYITDRIKNINVVLAKRKNYVPSINTIIEQIPSDISIDVLQVDLNVMSMTVTGKSLSDINGVIDLLYNLKNQSKIINQASIQSLTLDTDSGLYTLSVKANLP